MNTRNRKPSVRGFAARRHRDYAWKGADRPKIVISRLTFAAFTNVFAFMGFSTLSLRWLPVGESMLPIYRRDWLKVKCVQSETFVIIGYQPGFGAGARVPIANLKGATFDGNRLHYAGAVGSGELRAASFKGLET